MNENLLVDGEFQIWEEGTEMTSTINQTSYLSTMWSVSDSAHVSAKRNGNKGIKITSYDGTPPCHIQYLFEENFLQDGEKYMLSCVINGNKYTLPITAGTSISNERLGYTASRRVYVRLNVDDVCDFVKLEQGEIDTGLIHEKYAKALLESQRYLYINRSSTMGGNVYRNNVYANIYCPVPLRAKPTFKGYKLISIIDGIVMKNVEDTVVNDWCGNSVYLLYSFNNNPFTEGCDGCYARTIVQSGGYMMFDARIY